MTLTKSRAFALLILLPLMSVNVWVFAQVPHPDLGLRADWMRGSYGLNWKPAQSANGRSELESLTIKPFLEQIKGLKTVDYIQLHLGESFIYSPVHLGPHELLESFWQGDRDKNGKPLNLVVPRASIGRDPFLELIQDVREAGLKVQVYVNCTNMLHFWRGNPPWQVDPPDALPDVTERWMNWCDTNEEAQAFINSQAYHLDAAYPTRPYVFCYAEFVLKEYAIRYGDLIDAWLFDHAKFFRQKNGEALTGELEDQRIFQAFADACHAGNPDAAIAFSNGQGSSDLVNNPWAPATLFDDYMFGHPFRAGRNLGRYPENKFALTWLAERKGYIHTNDPNETRTWDDQVIGHFDPPMSTSAWNSGKTPALTNEEFLEWYSMAIMGGGAISFGIPLLDRNGWEQLIMEDYAMEQLSLLDSFLVKNQFPGSPNWARQETILADAYSGQEYHHTLVEGIDFWDPEGETITSLQVVEGDAGPSWLSIRKSESQAGTWIVGGKPTETEPTDYAFRIRVEDASGGSMRKVTLKVLTPNTQDITTKADSTFQWFKDAKFGMFIHFGVDNKSEFNPVDFDAGEWARIAREAGMKYVVLTTKHHVGFCLWDSELTDWNVVDQTPYKRDIVKDLAAGCKEEGIRMGCYYSIADYHHPLYEPKYQNRPNRRSGTVPGADITKYIDFMFGQLEELCVLYEPCLIWFDGGSGFRNPAHKPLLRRQELVDMLHSYGTISNSRLGDDDSLNIVDYLSMNDNMSAGFNLGVYFESAITMGDSWHYESDDELKSPQALLNRLITAAGNGGNLLLNVGPDHEGNIPEEMVSRLKVMGDWLETNGEAIYGTEAGPYPHEISWGSITQRQDEDQTVLYLNVVDWPETGLFTLFGLNNKILDASLLATGETIAFETGFDAASGENIIRLEIPKDAPDAYVSVIKLTIAGAAVMDQDFLQLSDEKVVLETYNATIHDLEYIANKSVRATDMRMYTVPQRGEGIMAGRGLTVSGFNKKGQALSWDFKVFKPGSYQVVVVCHTAKNQNWNMEGRVRAIVAGQSVENELTEYKRLDTPTMSQKIVDVYASLGTVKLDAAGAYTLSLEIASDFTGATPRYRSVLLIPEQQ